MSMSSCVYIQLKRVKHCIFLTNIKKCPYQFNLISQNKKPTQPENSLPSGVLNKHSYIEYSRTIFEKALHSCLYIRCDVNSICCIAQYVQVIFIMLAFLDFKCGFGVGWYECRVTVFTLFPGVLGYNLCFVINVHCLLTDSLQFVFCVRLTKMLFEKRDR